jgi:hypothetical protein
MCVVVQSGGGKGRIVPAMKKILAVTKTLAWFACALGLLAGSAFAQKTPTQKDYEQREDRKEVAKDRMAIVQPDRRDERGAESKGEKKIESSPLRGEPEKAPKPRGDAN